MPDPWNLFTDMSKSVIEVEGFLMQQVAGGKGGLNPDSSNSLRADVHGPREEGRIEVLIETFIRKQLRLKAHTVTKVEETEQMLVFQSTGWARLLRWGCADSAAGRCRMCENNAGGRICRCGSCR